MDCCGLVALADADPLGCDGGMSMVLKGRYVYVCPACGCTTRSPRLDRVPGKFRDTVSLVDGCSYPSCRQIEQLCFWCEDEKWGMRGDSCMVLPRKIAGAENSSSSTSSALVAGPLEPYSEIWAFLTRTTYEDGTTRRTGRLSLSFESGMLGLLLNDTETGQYAFQNGSSLQDLLETTELRLTDGSLPWKASKYPSKGSGKK